MPSAFGRLFIVGSQRSGTTLLQCLLAAHSQIVSLPETFYFTEITARRYRLARMLGLASNLQRPRHDHFLTLAGVPNDGLAARRCVSIRRYANTFVRQMDDMAARQGKCVWVEKTPTHLEHIDKIEKYVPNALFIHNVRNALDNIASLEDARRKYPEAWGKDWTFDGCIHHWEKNARATLRHAGRPNHLVVGYRQVVENPDATLQRVCRFIGVAFEEEMPAQYAEAASRVCTPDERWKADVSRPICNKDGTKYRTLLSAEQRRYIRERTDDLNSQLLNLCEQEAVVDIAVEENPVASTT